MIEGSLHDAPLSDVFQIIANGQKSGALTVAQGDARARVTFDQGKLQHARLSEGVLLGEVLVKLDLLTSYEVQQLLGPEPSRDNDAFIGVRAVAQGLLTYEDLHRAMKTLMIDILTELMLWRSGSFTFAERPSDATQIPDEHALDTTIIMVEIIKQLDRVRRSSVKPHTIFARSGDPTKVEMPAGGWELLSYLDGKRSAASIVSELDMPERQAYALLSELQEREIIEPQPFQAEEPTVLLIAAHELLRRLLRLALQRARLQPLIAQSHTQGMALVARDRPKAIVILDDEAAHGWPLVEAIRETPGQSHLPVLLLSNREAPRQGWLRRFRKPKAQVLPTPFHEIEFQQCITNMLGRSLT